MSAPAKPRCEVLSAAGKACTAWARFTLADGRRCCAMHLKSATRERKGQQR